MCPMDMCKEPTFLPLTLTAPCTQNCLACLALLAKSALNTAISNLLSIGAKAMFM